MILQSQESLIAKKMALESEWNQKYLEQGAETLDMMQIDLELKSIKRKIREQDEFRTRATYNSEQQLDITT